MLPIDNRPGWAYSARMPEDTQPTARAPHPYTVTNIETGTALTVQGRSTRDVANYIRNGRPSSMKDHGPDEIHMTCGHESYIIQKAPPKPVPPTPYRKMMNAAGKGKTVEMANAIEQRGGGFSRALAQAMRAADTGNLQKILEGWADDLYPDCRAVVDAAQ